jgi:hypothetical protein
MAFKITIGLCDRLILNFDQMVILKAILIFLGMQKWHMKDL